MKLFKIGKYLISSLLRNGETIVSPFHKNGENNSLLLYHKNPFMINSWEHFEGILRYLTLQSTYRSKDALSLCIIWIGNNKMYKDCKAREISVKCSGKAN